MPAFHYVQPLRRNLGTDGTFYQVRLVEKSGNVLFIPGFPPHASPSHVSQTRRDMGHPSHWSAGGLAFELRKGRILHKALVRVTQRRDIAWTNSWVR
jgi:hypothetical protein